MAKWLPSIDSAIRVALAPVQFAALAAGLALPAAVEFVRLRLVEQHSAAAGFVRLGLPERHLAAG